MTLVYVGVSADDVRRIMHGDMLSLVMPPPRNGADALRRWRSVGGRLGMPLRWPTEKARKLDLREERIVALAMQGLTPPEIAERLVDEGLYPIRERGHDDDYGGDDELRNAERTVYRLVEELKAQRRLSEAHIRRRRPGRPRGSC